MFNQKNHYLMLSKIVQKMFYSKNFVFVCTVTCIVILYNMHNLEFAWPTIRNMSTLCDITFSLIHREKSNNCFFSSQEHFGVALRNPWKGGGFIPGNPFKPWNAVAVRSLSTLWWLLRLHVGDLHPRRQQQHSPSDVSSQSLDDLRSSNGFQNQQYSGILASCLEPARWESPSGNLAILKVYFQLQLWTLNF